MASFTRCFRYLCPFVLFGIGYLAFTKTGLYCWGPLLFMFAFIPLAELFLQPDPINLSEAEEQIAKSNPMYDFLLWAIVPAHIAMLYFFFISFSQSNLSFLDRLGRIIGMGLLCGAFGINVGHELGHRIKPFEQFLAKTLLLTSLYMHFFIEHNKGHHKHVATPLDPSSASYNQTLYSFWIQTFIGTQREAWKIAIDEARKKKRNLPWLFNEMVLFQVIQITFLSCIFFSFGFTIMCFFIASALLGAGLLETVNYIEHYGLRRKEVKEHLFERVQPAHSWNSNHILGRLMLFELSRHSDHHYLAARKYQVLRHFDDAPQMPTGYPGMIILALIPPLWFRVMHEQMRKYSLLPQQ